MTTQMIDDLLGARGLVEGPEHALRYSSFITLSRHIDLPFETCLEGLEHWQRPAERPLAPGGTRVTIRGAAEVGPDQYRIGLNLRPIHSWRALAMELRLTRWSTSSGSSLELRPLRNHRPRRRYFLAGHVVLDAAIAAIVDALATQTTGGAGADRITG
jgi:hypothetical protein